MERQAVSTDQAPKAIGPYSQGIRVGDFVFCAGQAGLDPATGRLVEGGIEAETRRVLQNLSAVLQQAGQVGGAEPEVLRVPFAAAGAGIRPGRYGDAEIIDLAPTMTALLGLPAPLPEGEPYARAVRHPEVLRFVDARRRGEGPSSSDVVVSLPAGDRIVRLAATPALTHPRPPGPPSRSPPRRAACQVSRPSLAPR